MYKKCMLFVRLDLGDKYSHLVILDQEGEVLEESRIPTTQSALRRKFAILPICRIALEVGAHSRWVSHRLKDLGHEVLVAHARKLRLIYHNPRKSDRVDAETLARLGRLDPKLLSPVHHRTPEAKAHLLRRPQGVGPVTALAYVLTLEDPHRFANSRDVGPCLGLVPRRDQSGDRGPQLRITKTGDSYLRRLLVGSAQYILGPFRPGCDLRR